MASVDIRVDARERLIEELKAWKANHPNVRVGRTNISINMAGTSNYHLYTILY
jgi:hypothetical protein